MKQQAQRNNLFKMATLSNDRAPSIHLAHCSNCGIAMTVAGGNYVCPMSLERGQDRCTTTPVNASSLVRQVAAQLLRRVMTDETVTLLTEGIQQTAAEKSNMQRQRLQNTEASIKDLGKLREQVLHPVEQELATYPEVAEEVSRINATRMGLAYESQVAQEELDKLAFISDAEGLREDAQDIITSLDDTDLEQEQALLSIFVQEIRVGLESAEIVYSRALPDEQGHARVTSDVVPLAR